MAKTLDQLFAANPRQANESSGDYEARISGLYNTEIASAAPTTTSTQPAASGYTEQQILNDPDLYAKYGNTIAPIDAISPTNYGQTTGMAVGGANEYNSIVNQSPGWEGSTLDAPATDPNAEMLELIRQMQEAQKAARIAGLTGARDSALSTLSGEESSIAPNYYDKRNQAAGQSDVGGMNFAQYMASRGIKGASGAMPEIYRNNALQGEIGKLNRQENSAKDDIARRRSEVETNYASDVAAADAGTDASSLAALITQMNADRSFALQESDVTGTYNGAPTTTQQQTDRDNYAATAGQYYENYQAEIDNILGNDDPTDDWKADILGTARQGKIQEQAEAKAAQMAAASEAEQQEYKDAFDMWKAYGTATAEIAAILGVPEGSKTADFNIDSINAATSRMNATTAQTNANRPSASNTSVNTDSYIDYIKANFGTDKVKIASYLEGLYSQGVDPDVINVLAEKYGV